MLTEDIKPSTAKRAVASAHKHKNAKPRTRDQQEPSAGVAVTAREGNDGKQGTNSCSTWRSQPAAEREKASLKTVSKFISVRCWKEGTAPSGGIRGADLPALFGGVRAGNGGHLVNVAHSGVKSIVKTPRK